ncbi:MAG: hypothetical protein ACTSRU_03500 [Candidatus Hodarchaeales archaeon]
MKGEKNTGIQNPLQDQYRKWLYSQRKKLLEIDKQLGNSLKKREIKSIKESREIVEDVGKDLSEEYDPVMLGLDSSIINLLVSNLGAIYEDLGKTTILDLDVVNSLSDDIITVIGRLSRQKRSYSCPLIIKQQKMNPSVDFHSTSSIKNEGEYGKYSRLGESLVKKPFIKKVTVPRRMLTPGRRKDVIKEITKWAEVERELTMEELSNLPYEIRSMVFKLVKASKITILKKITTEGDVVLQIRRFDGRKDGYIEQTLVY